MSSTRQGRLGRRLLVVAVAALVVVGLAWGALLVLLPPARVHALVQAQLARTVQREARFEAVSIGLWPPVRVTIRSPALAEPGGFAAGAAFRAAAVHLDLDLLALLRQAVVVRRLVIDQPLLHLVQHPDGTTNFDGLMKPQPAQRGARGPMDLEIAALAVNHGRLVLDHPDTHRRVTVVLDTRLGLSARAGGTQFATRGDTRISDYAFGSDRAVTVSALDRSLSKLELRIRHDGAFDARNRRLALTRLELDLGRARIALSGTVGDPGPRARLDLRARGQGVDFGDLLSYLAAADARLVSGVRGSGRMSFDLAIGGSLGPGRLPALDGTVAVSGASLHYPKAKVPLDQLSFTARFAPDQVRVADLAARVADQPLRGTIAVSRFADPEVQFTLRGNLDLDAVAPMVAPRDTRLGGRVALDVRGAGRAKDPGSMALEGRADLSRVSVASPTMPKPIEGVNGRIEFARDRAAVHGLSARAGKSSFTLEATLARPLAVLARAGTVPPAEVSFRFDSPWLDAAEILPSGSGGTLPLNASGGGSVHVARFLNRRLQVSDVAAEIAVQPNHITLTSYTLGAYGGRVSGSGAFDLADPASPGFELRGRAEGVSAEAFLSSFVPLHGWLTGTVGSSFDLAGSGATPGQLQRTLTAIGIATMVQGQLGSPALQAIANATRIGALREAHFDQARLPFRIVRGQVVTDSAHVSGGSCGDWRVAGAIGFDGRMDYALSGTLPRELADRIGARSALAAGALSDDQGRVLLDLRVRGPIAAPQVSWNPRAMRERLAGRASEALREESRSILQEVTRRTMGAPGDSGTAVPPQPGVELKKRANDLLRSILGGKRAAPESAARHDTTAAPARDTSKR